MVTKYTTNFTNKRVLVIGGTSGIGFSVAEACTEHGATVIVSSSRQTSIDNTISRLTTSYPEATDRVRGQPCDLVAEDVENNIKSLFEFATENGTQLLDHIVFTAGDRFGMVKLADVTPDDITRLSRVRLVGFLIVAKHALQYMRKSQESSLTSTSGVNAFRPGDGWSVMAGVGSALDGATKGLAKDMRPIRVNCVSPGAINTELLRGYAEPDQLQAMLDRWGGMALTGTVGRPEDVAEQYVAIMKNAFITGTTVHVEGGYLLK